MSREQILMAINKDSKVTADELAKRLGSDAATIEAELKAMEQEGIICGYPTLINWDKTDYEVATAMIEVKVAPQRGLGFDKIAERIYRFDEVTSVYLISGSCDLCVIIEGKSMKEIANFVTSKLSPLESVLSTATNFILKKYKDNGVVLAEPQNEDERMMITP